MKKIHIEYQKFELKKQKEDKNKDKCVLECRDGYFLIHVQIDNSGNTFILTKEQFEEIVFI